MAQTPPTTKLTPMARIHSGMITSLQASPGVQPQNPPLPLLSKNRAATKTIDALLLTNGRSSSFRGFRRICTGGGESRTWEIRFSFSNPKHNTTPRAKDRGAQGRGVIARERVRSLHRRGCLWGGVPVNKKGDARGRRPVAQRPQRNG